MWLHLRGWWTLPHNNFNLQQIENINKEEHIKLKQRKKKTKIVVRPAEKPRLKC